MAMAAKAAEAAADVERLLAQVLSQRPDERLDRLMAQQASEPSDGTAPPEQQSEWSDQGAAVDVSASLEADTDVVFAGSPTLSDFERNFAADEQRAIEEQQEEQDSGLFSDADDCGGEDMDMDDRGEGAEDAAGGEGAAQRRRRKRRARRRAQQSQRRSSSARLAELALPVRRAAGPEQQPPPAAARRAGTPKSAPAAAAKEAAEAKAVMQQWRNERLQALEALAVEYAALAPQLSAEDNAACIAQMEAMYAEVHGSMPPPPSAGAGAPSEPTLTSLAADMDALTVPADGGASPTRERPNAPAAEDPWSSVRKSAAGNHTALFRFLVIYGCVFDILFGITAAEHAVRRYDLSSEASRARPRAAPAVSQSVEETELLRSVQKALDESANVSSELSRSRLSGGAVSGGDSSVSGAATQRWKDLSVSRAVRRPPGTVVRWLETGFHHHSSHMNSHGFEIRGTEGKNTDSEEVSNPHLILITLT